MTYGAELVKELQAEKALMIQSMDNRADRIDKGWTDMDDCFISQRCEERGMHLCDQKIKLIQEDGGFGWFWEYTTLEGQLIEAKWVNTQYGCSLRAVMPDGRVVWTTATTKAGLARKGLKAVMCKRPGWFYFHSANSGMLGAYTGQYILFPSNMNYATGFEADDDPVEIKEVEK